MRADLMTISTPCYIIDRSKFESNLTKIKVDFSNAWRLEPIFGYSVKTNHLADFLSIAKSNRMLAEVVSDDEYNHALGCGFSPDQIIFNGPQKSPKRLIEALAAGSIVNLDHFAEIETIKESVHLLPGDKITVGLRVNFDLEKACAGETTAGNEVSRFGFCYENGDLAEAILALSRIGVRISGLHMHYSTKTRSQNVFKKLSETAGSIIKGYKIQDQIEYIDIGGGLFLGEEEYTEGKPTVHDYVEAICGPLSQVVDTTRVRLVLEPGAALIATAVSYLCEVLNVRNIRETRIATTNGSLLHINPFMAKRSQPADILYLTASDRTFVEKQIVCGATCMENDRMLYLNNDESILAGDRVLFRNTGAYTMGFNNCFINVPPYIYSCIEGTYTLLRDKKIIMMSEV